MGVIGDDILSTSVASSIIDVPLLLDWILQVYFSPLLMEAPDRICL
jgi:hypothetical protein